jgi:hypothetical protein
MSAEVVLVSLVSRSLRELTVEGGKFGAGIKTVRPVELMIEEEVLIRVWRFVAQRKGDR